MVVMFMSNYSIFENQKRFAMNFLQMHLKINLRNFVMYLPKEEQIFELHADILFKF